MAFAADAYGTWADGVQTGDIGWAQAALETSYNIQAGLEVGDLQADLQMMQAEFTEQAGAAYDEWYQTLTDQLADLTGQEFGEDGAEFDYFGGGSEGSSYDDVDWEALCEDNPDHPECD